jgi:GH24 family phage-related lysozyme (muramidase)
MADSSSKLIKALFSSSNSGENKTNFDASKINPRILKILGVNEFDIEDEQEYLSLLKEKMLLISMGKSKLPREDEEVIIEEFKRIKSKKFPKKKITADSFKRGTAVEDFINKNVGVNLNIKSLGGSIKPQQLALPPAVDKMSGKSGIQEIIDSLASIIEQLTLFNSLSRDEQERDRRATENRRRREREGELEKGFDGVMKAAEKVIAPVKSILDRIINFLVMTLIGRSLVLLLRWFNDKDNQEKVKAIGRFLGDHWPKLLALFIAFGTGLGGFVRGLIGIVIKGTGALIKGAIGLAARAKLKGASGALKFLSGPKGKLIGTAVELGAVAAGTVALSKGLENFGGIGGGEEATQKPQEPQKPTEIKQPVFQYSGGGLANLGKIFSGSMFGFGNNMESSGQVKGPKGRDKVRAMLTDGEFVMSVGAVNKYGVDTLESMNAAGGGNNRPKVVEGTTYAAGGGFIGQTLHHLKKDESLSSLTPNTNDFTRPGTKRWSTVKSNTPIYSYIDSVGQPTIGWGSTFYDSILNGKKPVRRGDQITKSKADQILNVNVSNLAKTYSTKVPNWNKMSDKQKSGLLILGYNAPYGPLGAYPKLTSALQSGDMKLAAQNVQRSGPNQERISLERQLLMSGPLNLKNLVGEKKVGSGIPGIPPFLHNISSKKQGGGILGNRNYNSLIAGSLSGPRLMDTSSPIRPSPSGPYTPMKDYGSPGKPNLMPSGPSRDPWDGRGPLGPMPSAKGGGSFGSDGKVLESTGYKNNHSSADRRFVPLSLHPDEYVKVFTKDFADRGGMETVRYLQAMLDPDSNARKQGVLSNPKISRFTPDPPSISNPKIVYVPSTSSKKTNVNNTNTATPKVPQFSASRPTSSRRRNAATYGIR